jgi:hypothetical protein
MIVAENIDIGMMLKKHKHFIIGNNVNLEIENTMTQPPKEKAKELITHYHNLIQDIGGELGQEILVSILARHCALFAAREVIKSKSGILKQKIAHDDILFLGRSRTRNRKL